MLFTYLQLNKHELLFCDMNGKCYDLNCLEKYKNNTFIHERNTVENENIYSYETIICETKKCLAYLQRYQVTSHAGIAVDLREHSAATCILLLGILNHDCHFYCMDFEAAKDIDSYIKASGVKYIISCRDLKAGNIKQLSKDITILKNVFNLYMLGSSTSTLESSRLCYTIATSGSTGKPKMVHVPFECVEPNIKSFSQLLKIQENDTIFLSSPPTFDPFVLEFFVALENGAKIVITSMEVRLLPHQLAKIIFPGEKLSKQGVTIYQTTPSLFRLYGREIIQNVIFSRNSSLRCLILGGEEFPCSLELKSWLPLDFCSSGKRIFNVYGITEVSCWASIYEFNAECLECIKVPLGSSLDDVTYFRLVDDASKILPRKECTGELEIGSYIRRCFIPQHDNDVGVLEGANIIYRKTGDLVECDSLGNLYYIGRINNTIKRFGKRICLDSLSKKAERLLNVYNSPFKVIALWQHETVKLIFCLFKSKETADNEKKLAADIFKKTLDDFEQPDKIFYNKQLPLNAHGKIDRKQMLQQLSAAIKSPAKIFKDFLTNVIGIKENLEENESNCSSVAAAHKRLKLSTDSSFLQAGGTSFQALSLATEIAELLEEKFEQRKILEMLLDADVTINDILKFLTSCSSKYGCQVTSHESFEYSGLSLNIKLLWRCDLKKCIDAAPSLFEDKYVSVGSHSHILLTVNALTGEEVSRLEFKDRIECPVVFVTSQLAVAGCYDGFLYGFDFNKGTIVWQLNVGGMIKAKPLLVNNTLLIASYAEDYNVSAFDIESLALVWKSKLGSKGIFASPVQISAELVLFCCLDGTYAVLDVQTGVIRWQQKLESPIFSTPIKIPGRNEMLLVVAEVKGLVSICRAENGEKLTSFQADGNIFSGLTLLFTADHLNHYSLIMFGCHDKNVYCLKLDHISKQLTCFSKYALNAAVYATPIAVSEHCVVACSTKGLMVLLDVPKNTVLASLDLAAEVFSTPKCLNGKYVYVGSRDNFLYCYQIANELN